MQTLKYVIGKDYRPLTPLEAKTSSSNQIDYGNNPNWIQGRQYEDSLRQVFIELTYDDGTPYDLTGTNLIFEGILPDGEHRIIDNSHTVFYDDPTSGKVRFDLPAPAFAVAGQYKQAFFRVTKGYKNLATLEFKFEVLADWVISGLQPRDYISPLEDFFNQINDELLSDKNKLQQVVDDFKTEVNGLYTTLKTQSDSMSSLLDSLNQRIEIIEQKIKDNDLFTYKEAETFKTSIQNMIEADLNSYEYHGLRNLMLKDDVPGVLEKLKDFAEKIDTSKMNILFIPDIHYTGKINDPDVRYATAGPAVIQMVRNLSLLDNKIDAVFVGGDQIHGNEFFSAPDIVLNKWRNTEVANTIFSAFPTSDVFFTEGNHDNGSVWTLDKDLVLTQDELEEIYHVNNPTFDEHRLGFFAYKDYPQKQTRLITINMYENPTSFDGNNKLIHPTSVQSILTASQLNSLVNALKSVPDGYKVLIQGHSAPQGYSINPSTKKVGKDNTGLRDEKYINHDVLNAILSGYANKRAVSVTGTDSEFPVSISTDFSNAKGTLVGLVVGHYHYDGDMDIKDGVRLWNRICFIPENRMVVSATDGTLKDPSNRYAVDVISLDASTITFNRFHVGSDDTTKYTGAGRTMTYEY
ncbi:BppU family phage baseplate upper protein [Ligilactobacillus agilis]|uniref:BppU family phage baseplate upper protein n=1 Tax=Ligilactobacillus agilis TaxID=1601 RepID=UPI0025A389AB|nr:BppU family phage baseplate upper protein [Ligilactobacillus agilis]MDM8279627.1 BppU family phage baseplate upper protein [Ligilactobacillus agilis]